MSAPDFLARPDGKRLAYRLIPGTGPVIIFLPGYLSDMAGSKAEALASWAAAHGRAMLRFDYAGCGESEGDARTETLVSWRDDALLLIDTLTTGPILPIGSSMGGWIALLIALARPDRVAGLVGIAAAPDFTDWGYEADQKAVIARDGILMLPNPYGPQDSFITRGFFESGQALRLMDAEIGFDGPVRLIQGQQDPDVPWQNALKIAAALRSADVQLHFVKGGDHRLSRDADIALICQTVAHLLETLT